VRRSVLVVASVSAAGVLASIASAAPSGGRPTISEATVSRFPDKAYSLSLPAKAKLTTGSVTVLENGRPVHDLRLQAPGASGGATILAIDASNSMAGKPIKEAMVAARAFAARRTPGQLLGVVTFNGATNVLLPPTADPASIRAALAKTPPLAEGTHIYDGVDTAVQALTASGAQVGAVVLLSDGKDVGSTVSASTATSRASDANIRVFTVGLRSRQFDGAALEGIAGATGATSTVASNSAQLSSIYDDLGYTLSNQYLIRYRSLAGPSKRIALQVRVKGFDGVARTAYVTPALPTGTTTPYQKSTWDTVVQSTTTAAVVIVILVFLVGMAVFIALRRRDRRFERRLSQFVSLPLEERAQQRRADVTAELERNKRTISLGNFAWYTKLEEDVENARIDMRPSTIVGLTFLLGLVIGIVVATVTGTPWGLLAGLVAPLVPRAIISSRKRAVLRSFEEQLADNLDVLSSALRTGHSFVGALSVAVEGADEPSQSEFRRAIADEQLGVPIEEALRVISIRMENRDLLQVALVARLQRDAGTNAAEVLDQVAINIRHRMELRRLIRTLTAQGRMARWIVSILPIFLFCAIYVLNKNYLSPLWTHNVGIAAMVVAAIMIVSGSLVIKRIVEIEV
jgi:tight adherence protein B